MTIATTAKLLRVSEKAPKTLLEKLAATAKREHWQRELFAQVIFELGPRSDVKREYQWHPTREFAADVAIVDEMLLVECDGGLYVNGGHTRGAARERDYERDADAMILGYRVLRVSPRHVKDGRALRWITELLK